jgi:hypothetical protein
MEFVTAPNNVQSCFRACWYEWLSSDHEEFHLVSLTSNELIQAFVNQDLKDQTEVWGRKWMLSNLLEFLSCRAIKHNPKEFYKRLKYVSILSTANLVATIFDDPGHATIFDFVEIDSNNFDNCPVWEYIPPPMPSASSGALTAFLAIPALSSVILPLHLLKNNMAAFPS